MHEVQHAVQKERQWQAKAGVQLAEKTGQSNPLADRQASPEQDQKYKAETSAADAVWLHGSLKVHVRQLCQGHQYSRRITAHGYLVPDKLA